MANDTMKMRIRGGFTFQTVDKDDDGNPVYREAKAGEEIEVRKEVAQAFTDRLEPVDKELVGEPVARLSDGSTHGAEAYPEKSHEAPASQPSNTPTSGEPHATGKTTEAQGLGDGTDEIESGDRTMTTVEGDTPTQTSTTQPKGDNVTGKGAGVVADDAAGTAATTAPGPAVGGTPAKTGNVANTAAAGKTGGSKS